jgi:hypothetical protein
MHLTDGGTYLARTVIYKHNMFMKPKNDFDSLSILGVSSTSKIIS